MIHTLIQLAESWWPLYAVHMLETSLFILVVWALDRWVHLDTRLRYSLWLCALVKTFVPPFYALALPTFLSEAPTPVQPVSFGGEAVWSEMSYVAPVALPPEPIPMVFWAFTLWSVSVIVFVGMTLWRNLAFQRTLGIANPVSLSGDLDDLTQGANLKVFSKANLTSPLLVGVVKPRLYLPSTWQTWTPTQLRGIVAHELAHYHNRDLWALAFQVLATVFCGLNPLIWLVNRRLAHLRELRCDEDALLKSGISPVEYGKLLYAFLDANTHPGLPALGFNEKDTPLKKRFEHVLNFKGGTMKRSKWQYAIPVLVALAIVPFSIRETYSQPQEVVQKASDTPLLNTPSSEQGRIRVKPIKRIPASYPESAEKNGIEGYVHAELTIDPDGTVSGITMLEGDTRFLNSVTTALLQYRYTPFTHANSIKKKQIIAFQLAGDSRPVYSPAEEVMKKSDFGPMVVMGEAPGANSENKTSTVSADVLTRVEFTPLGEKHVKMSLLVGVDGATPRDQEVLKANRSEILKTIHKIVSGDGRDVFYEEGMRFQVRQEIRFMLEHQLKVKIKDVKLGDAQAKTELTQMSDIWVNYKGDMLINMNKAVTVNELEASFRLLKNDQNTKTLLMRVDRGAPQHIIDAIQQSATRVGIEVRDTGGPPLIQEPSVITQADGLQILQFFKVDHKPKPITKVDPIYPPDAKAKGLTGKVFLKFLIHTDGSVSDVKVLRGKEEFHQAAIDAILQYKFEPAKHQGQIVPVWMTQPISFQLENSLDKSESSTPESDMLKVLETRNAERNQILDASQVDEKPHPVRIVTPQYPEEAKAQGIEGNVLVSGVVNTDGTVSDLKIVSGDEMFHESALVAAKQMRFRPAKHQGQTVPVRLTMPMDFRLKSSQSNRQLPLGLRGGFFGNKRMSEIWINTKGDLLIDQYKAVTLETLGSELAQLKEQKNIDTILLKPDVKTPMSHVQKVLDVVGQTGLKVQMISVDLAELKERNRPKDLNNIEFYQADVKPEPIHQVAPEYPEIARKAGLTGKVFLKFRVNVDGSVSDVSVLRGQQIFRKAAMEAIEKFRFKPAEYDGKIVAVWMTQPVSFRLGLGKPLEAQTLDFGTFTIKVPNGHDGNALIQPRLTLNVISAGAADVITDDLDKAQKMASSYLSSIPLDQWVSAEQQNAILEGVREQVNVGFGAPLINSVTFSNLTLTPSEYLAENREFKLHTNFPNPFNPETAIQYEVAEPVFVRMEIYNVTGQVIRTLVAEDKSPGKYETRWDGKDDQGKLVASGVYYYHINAGSFNAVKKMQLVK